MTRFTAAFWALALLIVSPLQAQEAETPPISAAEAGALESALTLGEKIYRYDQAAWHTTDALLEDIPDPGAAGVRGWVVIPVEAGHQVTYWKPAGNSFEAVYSATYDGKTVSDRKRHSGEGAALSAEQISLIRAGIVPDPSKVRRCSEQPFNSVIVPSGKDNGSIYMYLLVPQADLSSVPLGGHYRFEVLDGKVIGERAFTNSCISLAIKNEDKNEKLSGLAISHLLDPVPTEIHAFSAYVAKVPLYVIISEPNRLWSVEIKDGAPRASLVDR